MSSCSAFRFPIMNIAFGQDNLVSSIFYCWLELPNLDVTISFGVCCINNVIVPPNSYSEGLLCGVPCI